MSMRFGATTYTAPLEALLNRLDQINEIVDEVGQGVYEQWAPEMLTRLQQAPGPAHSPVIWVSDAQRRAFFATNGFGGGIPHVRTGDMANGWEVELIASPGQFRIEVRNRKTGARFVYGSLARDPAAAARFQSAQHKATGHPLASPIVQFYLGVMYDQFADDLRARFGDLTTITGRSSRAITPRLR